MCLDGAAATGRRCAPQTEAEMREGLRLSTAPLPQDVGVLRRRRLRCQRSCVSQSRRCHRTSVRSVDGG